MQVGTGGAAYSWSCFTHNHKDTIAVHYTVSILPHLCILDVHSEHWYIAGLQGRGRALCEASRKALIHTVTYTGVEWSGTCNRTQCILQTCQSFVDTVSGDAIVLPVVGYLIPVAS